MICLCLKCRLYICNDAETFTTLICLRIAGFTTKEKMCVYGLLTIGLVNNGACQCSMLHELGACIACISVAQAVL